MTKLTIRDAHAQVSGSKETIDMPSGGLEVVGEDGRTLFGVRLAPDGMLEVSGGSFCKHEGRTFDDRLIIEPCSSNRVYIRRPEYGVTK